MIQNNYSPAFGGTPVGTTKIKKIVNGKISTVTAVIEQISRECPKDVKTIEKIVENWSQDNPLPLLYWFKRSFMSAEKKLTNFWIKAPNKDIIGIIQTTNPQTVKSRNSFDINYLLAKPSSQTSKTKYKGVGTAGILHAVQTAKENNFKAIHLFSLDTAIKFYEKLGLKKSKNVLFRFLNGFELSSKDFSSFISNHGL